MALFWHNTTRVHPPHLPFLHRLSIRQQKELCHACAAGAHARSDILGEARALAHLGIGRDNLSADTAMARASATVEQGLEANHPVHAAMLLSRAVMHINAGRYQQVQSFGMLVDTPLRWNVNPSCHLRKLP